VVKRVISTNIVLRLLISDLRKYANQYKAPVWDAVADILSKSSRRRPAVNLSKISRYSGEGDVIVVPGKVLGSGTLNKRITVAAFSFSKTALDKIKASGSRSMTIRDLLKENPEGRGVKIII